MTITTKQDVSVTSNIEYNSEQLNGKLATLRGCETFDDTINVVLGKLILQFDCNGSFLIDILAKMKLTHKELNIPIKCVFTEDSDAFNGLSLIGVNNNHTYFECGKRGCGFNEYDVCAFYEAEVVLKNIDELLLG